MLQDVAGTVGVICPRALRERVWLVSENPRVQVLDPWQAKGLEFDGCLVLAPEQIVTEGRTREAGLRTLYVALTRATQRLTVVSEALPPWLLPG